MFPDCALCIKPCHRKQTSARFGTSTTYAYERAFNDRYIQNKQIDFPARRRRRERRRRSHRTRLLLITSCMNQRRIEETRASPTIVQFVSCRSVAIPFKHVFRRPSPSMYVLYWMVELIGLLSSPWSWHRFSTATLHSTADRRDHLFISDLCLSGTGFIILCIPSSVHRPTEST